MSESISETYTVTAPSLTGVWVFDPAHADTTDANYVYADGREETIDPKPDEIELMGRVNPLIEYGETTLVGLTLTIFVPFGAGHGAAVQYWRDATDARRTLCYRDNRGRLVYGALNKALSIVDGRAGTALAIGLRRVDYDESA